MNKFVERCVKRAKSCFFSTTEHAIIAIDHKQNVMLDHNMEPVKLAIVLGKLCEELVKESGLPILEADHGATKKREGKEDPEGRQGQR